MNLQRNRKLAKINFNANKTCYTVNVTFFIVLLGIYLLFCIILLYMYNGLIYIYLQTTGILYYIMYISLLIKFYHVYSINRLY